MNVAETILSRGEDFATAIFYHQKEVTYGELKAQVRNLSAELRRRGLTDGDRVGIVSENSPFFVAAYLATIRAGLVAVPLQTELRNEMAAKIAADAGMKAVLVSRRFSNAVHTWAQTLRLELLIEGSIGSESAASDGQAPANRRPDDLAALMFTSGSTGAPKGVMISHRNIECNTTDIVEYMGLTPVDRVMVVLPFHYCFGMSLLHTHLLCGGSLVLNNDFRLYPEMVLREMLEKACTGIAGVPSTYQILLRKSRFSKMVFPQLHWFQQAGGKLPNPCIAEIREAFPRVQYFLMYGQTEGTARLSYLPPEQLGQKLGSIGKGLPSTRLAVLQADGTPVAPGSAEIGEIVATGDNIALGYWNDPVETAKFFKTGRLYTGDIARVDREGFIYVVEREREMIKSGGNRVSAKEVEDVIAELPEVVEVAVVGAPHSLLGEAIKAFTVVAPGCNLPAKNIAAYCRKRLPPYAVPEEVTIIDEMPHNESGKILKNRLKEIAQSTAGMVQSSAPVVAACLPA